MRHPIESCIRQFIYMRERATLDDLAEYGLQVLPSPVQEEIVAAIERGVVQREAADPQWDSAATQAAREIIAGLPPKWQDPKAFGKTADPLANVTNPDELAAAVPRF